MDTESVAKLNELNQSVGINAEFFTMTAGMYLLAFCWVPSLFKLKRYGVKNFFLGTFCLIYGLAIPGMLNGSTKTLIEANNSTLAYFVILILPLTALIPGFCAALFPASIAVKKKATHPRWIIGLNVFTLVLPAWPLWLPLLCWACWDAHEKLPDANTPGGKKRKRKNSSAN